MPVCFPVGRVPDKVSVIHGVKQPTVSAFYIKPSSRVLESEPQLRALPAAPHARPPWKSAIGPFGHQLCQKRFSLAFAKSGAEGGAPGCRLRPTAVLARLAFSACA